MAALIFAALAASIAAAPPESAAGARRRGELTIRGVTRPAQLAVRLLGPWAKPWWEDGRDHGPRTRAGFVARARRTLFT